MDDLIVVGLYFEASDEKQTVSVPPYLEVAAEVVAEVAGEVVDEVFTEVVAEVAAEVAAEVVGEVVDAVGSLQDGNTSAISKIKAINRITQRLLFIFTPLLHII